MKAFHTITIPHKDILEGRLSMDVFAADLWEVSNKRGVDEYKDPETFFKKTYLTEGLDNLLSVVKNRLEGKRGDPVIQIQTPFGGGKTHALIAMYHKSHEWNANRAVVVGTALSKDNTLWGTMEKQLTGKIDKLSGQIAPGKEALRELFSTYQPLLILVDEVLEYTTKAAGVKVGDTSLASQTLAFLQELTEIAGSLEKTALVITLPSSVMEHYDENAEKLFQQLQKVSGRTEKIYTPVRESEITQVIRRRLFSDINEDELKKNVSAFVDYSRKEEILPTGTEPSQYKEAFLDSYPFLPEVVNVLYHRWGSYPTFQRTRGVLRLLSLIIHSLKETNKPYISLSDFDLSNSEIRQELLRHIGAEFNSIIDADISGKDAGAKKIDKSLGGSYQGLHLGTRAATTIFLYSFSGGGKPGALSREIKRAATTVENPSSVVAEANEQLKNILFYLQNVDEKYFFSNQPNLNRILLTKMENLSEEIISQEEFELLKNNVKGDKLKVFLWEDQPRNIPDNEALKLIVLKEKNIKLMEDILKTKGETPRVYRNTLIFLCPLESKKSKLKNKLGRKIAFERIQEDTSLKLSQDQKKQVKKQLNQIESDLNDSTIETYRVVGMPSKEGVRESNLGVPTYGEGKKLDQEVLEKLRNDGEVLESIAPIVIREKYLPEKDCVSTKQLCESSLKTPGETRVLSRDVFRDGIFEGVKKGLFGLGDLENDKPNCRYFKEAPTVAFSDNEVLISEGICRQQKGKGPEYPPHKPFVPPMTEEEGRKGEEPPIATTEKIREKVRLNFQVPRGRISDIMGLMNLLQNKFQNLEIDITATQGSISEQDYEDKIKETFRQLGIDFEEE